MKTLSIKDCSDAFFAGMERGIRMYAWWKDGLQYVGSCGTPLTTALANLDNDYGRQCPHENIRSENDVRSCFRCGVAQ